MEPTIQSESIHKNLLPQVLKDLVAMSRFMSIGSDLVSAWSLFIAHEENAEAKEFFETMNKNWKELPPEAPLRVAPTFEAYAPTSREWKLLYDAVVYGESSGMLETSLMVASILIVLSWKLEQSGPSDADKQLFQTASSLFYSYDWSAWPEIDTLKSEAPAGFDDGSFGEACSSWLQAESSKAKVQAIVPPYIIDKLQSQAEQVGIPDAVAPMLRTITNYSTAIDLYRP